MTDIYTSEAAGFAALELVDALIQRLVTEKFLPAAYANMAADEAILQLETLKDEGRGSPAAMDAAQLIRERYPLPDAARA